MEDLKRIKEDFYSKDPEISRMVDVLVRSVRQNPFLYQELDAFIYTYKKSRAEELLSEFLNFYKYRSLLPVYNYLDILS